MELRVAKIASIEFRHEYFAETGFDWNADWPPTYTESLLPLVKPSKQTKQFLENSSWYLKRSRRGLAIYAEVKNEGGKLIAKLGTGQNTILYFKLSAPTLSWPLFTRNLKAEKGIALFGNLSGSKPSGSTNLYLHNEVLASAAGTKEPATVVRKASKVYEALERTNSQPPGAFWLEIGTGVDYTTLSNAISVNRGSVLVSEPSLANATVEIKDVYGRVVLQKSFASDSTEKEANLDLKHLDEGVYSYHFNSALRDTFYLAEESESLGFGLLVVAIQGNPDGLPIAQRLDEEWLPVSNGTGSKLKGEINPREFIIHFLHPTAKWRFAFSRDLTIPNSDVPSDYEKVSTTIYQSKKARALQRTSKGPDFGLNQNLPAPEPSILLRQLNGSEELEAFISTTYVNV
jgi:hypothetical protein